MKRSGRNVQSCLYYKTPSISDQHMISPRRNRRLYQWPCVSLGASTWEWCDGAVMVAFFLLPLLCHITSCLTLNTVGTKEPKSSCPLLRDCFLNQLVKPSGHTTWLKIQIGKWYCPLWQYLSLIVTLTCTFNVVSAQKFEYLDSV